MLFPISNGHYNVLGDFFPLPNRSGCRLWLILVHVGLQKNLLEVVLKLVLRFGCSRKEDERILFGVGGCL